MNVCTWPMTACRENSMSMQKISLFELYKQARATSSRNLAWNPVIRKQQKCLSEIKYSHVNLNIDEGLLIILSRASWDLKISANSTLCELLVLLSGNAMWFLWGRYEERARASFAFVYAYESRKKCEESTWLYMPKEGQTKAPGRRDKSLINWRGWMKDTLSLVCPYRCLLEGHKADSRERD